jgi:hypothetical protein
LAVLSTPGFLAVYYDSEVVWVPALYVSLGLRPGIQSSVAVEGASLLEVPMREATILEIVQEG